MGAWSRIVILKKLKARKVTQISRQGKMDGVEDFLKKPAPEKLELSRKGELIEIGQNLKLGIKRSTRKNEMIRIITEHIIDEHIFGEEMLNDLPVESTDMSVEQIELENVRIQAKLELEKARIMQGTRLRELSIMRTTKGDNNREFDITKQVGLILKFAVANIDEYFAHFERTALNMEWPK